MNHDDLEDWANPATLDWTTIKTSRSALPVYSGDRSYRNVKSTTTSLNLPMRRLPLENSTKASYFMHNQYEYLSELTEAFFGANDWSPFNTRDLEKFDPDGFALMKSLWNYTEYSLRTPGNPAAGPNAFFQLPTTVSIENLCAYPVDVRLVLQDGSYHLPETCSRIGISGSCTLSSYSTYAYEARISGIGCPTGAFRLREMPMVVRLCGSPEGESPGTYSKYLTYAQRAQGSLNLDDARAGECACWNGLGSGGQWSGPANYPAGYSMPPNCFMKTLAADLMRFDCISDIACDTDDEYDGQGLVQCAWSANSVSFGGCEKRTCTLRPDAEYGDAYNLGGCSAANTPTTTPACSATCAAGAYGSAEVKCPQAMGKFVINGCDRSRCFAAEDTPYGYEITGCDSSAPEIAFNCDVECEPATHRGSAQLQCSADNGNFTYSGCAPWVCNVPDRSLAASLGYNIDQCLGPSRNISMCDVECRSGYEGTAVASCPYTEVGTSIFQFSGCVEQTCSTLNPPPSGYEVLDCPTAENLGPSSCTVTCAQGYTGNPEAYCDGTLMMYRGCSENQCSIASMVGMNVGMNLSSCRGPASSSNCNENLDCLPSHAPTSSGKPVASCASNGGQFSIIGDCVEKTCMVPLPQSDVHKIYDLSECFSAEVGATIPFSNCKASCRENYHGTVEVNCASHPGGPRKYFEFSGCSENVCPEPDPVAGYALDGCKSPYGNGLLKASQCVLKCEEEKGIYGTPIAKCKDARMTLEGCAPGKRCEVVPVIGYNLSKCRPAHGSALIRPQNCNVSCSVGFARVHPTTAAKGGCSRHGEKFTFSGCARPDVFKNRASVSNEEAKANAVRILTQDLVILGLRDATEFAEHQTGIEDSLILFFFKDEGEVGDVGIETKFIALGSENRRREMTAVISDRRRRLTTDSPKIRYSLFLSQSEAADSVSRRMEQLQEEATLQEELGTYISSYTGNSTLSVGQVFSVSDEKIEKEETESDTELSAGTGGDGLIAWTETNIIIVSVAGAVVLLFGVVIIRFICRPSKTDVNQHIAAIKATIHLHSGREWSPGINAPGTKIAPSKRGALATTFATKGGINLDSDDSEYSDEDDY